MAVIDHHTSVQDRIIELVQEMDTLFNLCCTSQHHCAASLVEIHMSEFLEGKFADLEKKVAILRKKDVWEYDIRPEWAEDAQLFRSYISEGVITMPMIKEFFDDMPACLEKGRAAERAMLKASEELFEHCQCKLEEKGLKICVLELHERRSFNTRDFLRRCQAFDPAIVVFAQLFGAGTIVQVLVKRTSEAVGDVGDICHQLSQENETMYKGGGGHPFAAGLQVSGSHFNFERISQDLHHAALLHRDTISQLK